MKLKTVMGAAALTLIGLPAGAWAQAVGTDGDHAAKLAEAKAIIAVAMPAAQRDQMMRDLMANLGQSMTAVPPQFKNEPGLAAVFQSFHDSLPDMIMPIARKHLPMIFDATAEAYTRAFTLAQLKDVHAFADTPSGAYYMTHSMGVMGDPAVIAANTAYMKELQGLQGTAQQALLAKIEVYLKAHPDVAKRLAAKPAPRKP